MPKANPQDTNPCRQMVPVSLGRVRVLSCVRVVGSSVVENEELLSEITSSPVFVTLNLVTPDAEAESMSPLFV